MALVSKNFSDIITFTRASSATFVGSNGLIQSAAIDAPRFDYDPVTLAAKGLLIEEQRTNLLTYSEQFDNAGWAKSNASISANTATSPDGATTADSLIEDTSTSQHATSHIFNSGVANTTYTFSVFLKQNTRTKAQIVITDNATGEASTIADLAAGAVTAPTVSGNWSAPVATIQPASNGYYRVVLTVTKSAIGNTSVVPVIRLYTTSNSYTGDGTSGIFIWGAQLEAGSFATSYIPTVASQVTRSADVASVNTLSPWYNATEGTLYAEADVVSLIQPTAYLAAFNDSTSNELIGLYQGNNAVGMIDIDNGIILVNITRTAIAVNTPFKAAGAYKLDDFALTLNASAVTTDTTATLPTVNTLNIGGRNGGGSPFSGHLRRITYYPRRLSNAELQAITA